jgi:hypothetical protein
MRSACGYIRKGLQTVKIPEVPEKVQAPVRVEAVCSS